MAEFSFSSMTANDALFIGSDDVINVASGSANQTTVIFSDLNYTVTIGGRTLTFGHAFHDVVDATPHTRLLFPDNSVLYIGDTRDNYVDLTSGQQAHDGGAYGGEGADSLTAAAGDWLIQGNQGDDSIAGRNGHDTIYGGQGDDVINLFGNGSAGFAQGNKGNDSLSSNSPGDTLLGGQGNDTIHGPGGSGGLLDGNLGNDSLTGSGQLLGEDGNDTIEGGLSGATTIRGGAGEDSIVAAGGEFFGYSNAVFGDDGNDVIVARSFRYDELHGGAGNDTISSSGTLILQDVGDLLDGGDGEDSLVGSGGVDTLSGGDGADTLSGGPDSDALIGGAGADRFVMTDVVNGGRLIQDDKIYDWEVVDRIEFANPFHGGYAEITAATYDEGVAKARDMLHYPSLSVVAVQVGSDVWVFNAAVDVGIAAGVMLVGRTLNDVSADNFI